MNPWFFVFVNMMIRGTLQAMTPARPRQGYTTAQIEFMVAELREELNREGVEGLVRG